MKRTYLLAAVSAVALSAATLPASAVTIDYSNTASHNIIINPADGCGGPGTIGCFSFTSSGPSISITSGSALGFTGGISSVYGVGPITTTSTPAGPVETAAVNGTGVLSIFDGAFTLTADLSWVDIASFGTAGNLNTQGTANLTNIIYGGSNADLLALVNAGGGINTLTFQFANPATLTNLFTTRTTTTQTSFSGSITPVPVPGALWLFGSGLLGLAAMTRKQRN